MCTRNAIGSGWVATAAALLLALPVSAGLFAVEQESGTLTPSSGDRLAYDLFVPRPASGLPAPPYAAVVLTHGFMRNKRYHANNARYLAERGIVVLTPNLSSLLRGSSDQLRNIANTQEQVAWLAARTRDLTDPLYGRVDPARIGLAGHSAGGAISFEAAVGCQATDLPVAALCLLDGVPWSRTTGLAKRLRPLPLCSLRADPSDCNADGSVLNLLDGLTRLLQNPPQRGA